MAKTLTPDLQQNTEALKTELGQSMDLILRPFTTGEEGVRKALLICIDGLADGALVTMLMDEATRLTHAPYRQPPVEKDPVLALKEFWVKGTEVTTTQDLSKVVEEIIFGKTVLLIDGSANALVLDTRYNPARSPEEPSTETEVRGPRDGFVENLIVNTALLRRRIRDPKLRLEALQVGTRTRTDVVVGYIEGVADSGVVDEVKRRIKSVKVDGIIESGQLQELIQDTAWSPFSTINYTERPDRAAMTLLQGRVLILTDNTPFVLLVPSQMWHYFQAPGDYYHNFWIGSMLRWLRLLALMIAFTLPSMYVILTSYHHEMIPTPLALSMAAGREGTPLPTILEVLLMEVMFEVLQEAGLRLPRAVGQTVSIVGALVIGEAAVQAGLVAPATVIVTATAGVTSFALPAYAASLTVRLLRFPLLLLSGTLGVFGFLAGISAVAMHICSLRSFGAPFLSPAAPFRKQDVADSLWRPPLWMMDRRARYGKEPAGRRQAPNQMPSAPPGNGGGGP